MPNDPSPRSRPLADRDVALDRDTFSTTLVAEIAHVLQDLVGTDRAAGFISLVGAKMGSDIRSLYRAHLPQGPLDDDTLAAILVDLKARIEGGFSVESVDPEKIVLVNDACPFGARVIGRESLCMMTSNVFGKISADERGYAKVTLDETIARGDGRCRVVVWMKPTDAAGEAEGREYFDLQH